MPKQYESKINSHIKSYNDSSKPAAFAIQRHIELCDNSMPLRLKTCVACLANGVWSANFITAMAATSEVEASPLSMGLIGDSAVALRLSLQSQAAIYFSNTCTAI